MWIKLTGAVLILISGSGIGIYYAGKIKTHINSLVEMRKILSIMAGEIRFGTSTLWEISSRFSKNPGTYQKFFFEVSKKMESEDKLPFRQIWEQSANANLKDTCLSGQDIVSLKRLGENLGCLDVAMQLDSINLYSQTLDADIDKLSSISKEKIKLCYSLGIIGSIFLIILLY